MASRGAHRPNDIIKALRLIAAAQAIDLELQRRPRVRSARVPPSEIEEVGFVCGPSFARHPVCGPQLKKVVEVARSKPFGVCVDVREDGSVWLTEAGKGSEDHMHLCFCYEDECEDCELHGD